MNLYKTAALLSAAFILLICSAPNVQAQQNSDGSLYSRFGIGDLFQYHSAQIQGMGGGGTALTSLNYVNTGNPATWSDQQLTRISGSVLFQGLEIANENGDASRLNSSLLESFQFSFPIKSGKLGAVISYAPYSRVAHRVKQTETVLDNDPTLINPAAYSISFQGKGGLQKASVGIGFRPSPRLSVGASTDFIFGILSETRVTEFNTSDLFRTSFSSSTRLAGVSTTLGALFSVPRLLSNQDALSIGMSISTPTSLAGTQTQTVGEGLGRDTLGVALKGDVDLPIRTNLGLSYHANQKWTFVANYTLEPWSSFDSELSLPGFIPGESSFLDDRSRFSAGASFLPSGNPLDPYFKRVGFRLGFYTDTGYIKLSDNQELNTVALTGGISMPTLFPGTRIDLNLEIGRRGSTNQNLVKESFFKFHLNVNIGERWFERRKLG
ncbi:MAG: hypothetical protein AB8G77_13730 [Rhodothermales bacterium]